VPVFVCWFWILLSKGKLWLLMNGRESFMRKRGTSLRATLKKKTMNKTRGPERALSSGGSSTTTGCILPRSTTVTLS
ncbi:hypothetical protein LDENG_00128640, partial [Lucifuga dentata]